MIINTTQDFGKDNEPTKEYMDRVPYFINTRVVEIPTIKISGRNMAPAITINGYRSISNSGTAIGGKDSGWYSTDFITLKPRTKYSLRIKDGYDCHIHVFLDTDDIISYYKNTDGVYTQITVDSEKTPEDPENWGNYLNQEGGVGSFITREKDIRITLNVTKLVSTNVTFEDFKDVVELVEGDFEDYETNFIPYEELLVPIDTWLGKDDKLYMENNKLLVERNWVRRKLSSEDWGAYPAMSIYIADNVWRAVLFYKNRIDDRVVEEYFEARGLGLPYGTEWDSPVVDSNADYPHVLAYMNDNVDDGDYNFNGKTCIIAFFDKEDILQGTDHSSLTEDELEVLLWDYIDNKLDGEIYFKLDTPIIEEVPNVILPELFANQRNNITFTTGHVLEEAQVTNASDWYYIGQDTNRARDVIDIDITSDYGNGKIKDITYRNRHIKAIYKENPETGILELDGRWSQDGFYGKGRERLWAARDSANPMVLPEDKYWIEYQAENAGIIDSEFSILADDSSMLVIESKVEKVSNLVRGLNDNYKQLLSDFDELYDEYQSNVVTMDETPIPVNLTTTIPIVSTSDPVNNGANVAFEMESSFLINGLGGVEEGSSVISDNTQTSIGFTDQTGSIILNATYSLNERIIPVTLNDVWLFVAKLKDDSVGKLRASGGAPIYIRHEDGSAGGNTISQAEIVLGIYSARVVQMTDTTNVNLKLIEGDVGQIDLDYAYAYNLTELGEMERDAITLANKYPYIEGIQPVRNPSLKITGDNLCDIKSFIKNPYYPTDTANMIIDGSKITVNNLDHLGDGYGEIYKVIPGKSYTVSVKSITTNTNIAGGGRIRIFTPDMDNLNFTGGNYITAVHTVNANLYTTVVPTTDYIGIIICQNTMYDSPSSITVEELMVTEGTIPPKEYKPYIESKTTINNFFGKGDRLLGYSDGRIEKYKKMEFVELDGSFGWSLDGDFVNYKQVVMPLSEIKEGKNNSQISEKYNGKILSVNSSNPAIPDGCVFNSVYSSNLKITIADTDSGWGESYTPTEDEIKAYFNGWRMYTAVSSGDPTATSSSYNGTGTKAWAKIYNGNGTLSGTTGGIVGTAITTIPTLKSDDIAWNPYKLYYELETPYTEALTSEKGISTISGQRNTFSIESGIVEREKVVPMQNPTTPTQYTINNVNAYLTGNNNLLYKNGDIIKVWKETLINGELKITDDTRYWTKTTTYAYGKYRLYTLADGIQYYDPLANYYVDYQMLQSNYTNQQHTVALTYTESIKSTVSSIKTNQDRIDEQQSINTKQLGYMNSPIEKYDIDLLNGVTAASAIITLKRLGETLYDVTVEILTAANCSNDLVIGHMLDGFAPKENSVVGAGYMTNGDNVCLGQIDIYGQIKTFMYTASGTVHCKINYMVEV